MKLLSLGEIEALAEQRRKASIFADDDLWPFHLGILSQYYTWALESVDRLRKQRDEANERIEALTTGKLDHFASAILDAYPTVEEMRRVRHDG